MKLAVFLAIFLIPLYAEALPQRLRRPLRRTTPQPAFLIQDPNNQTLETRLDAADRRISQASAVYQDFRNKLASQFNWEHLLSPAPLSIAVLGDLMIVASNTLDFPINVINRTDGFQYMKYPSSFRASLVQISNSGYTAFNKAHTNMDKIRLYTMNVNSYMNEAVRILLSKEPEIIETLLPLPLKRIEQVATTSVELSLEVVSVFEFAINLTSEVLEACTATKGIKEIERADIIREKNITDLELTSTGQLLDKVKTDKEKYDKMIHEANEQVKQAIKSMPSGWKIIGMNLVEGFGNLITLNFNKIFAGSSSGESATATDSSTSTRAADDGELQCVVQHKPRIYRLRKIAETLVAKAVANFTDLSTASGGVYKADRDLKDLNRMKQSVPACEVLTTTCEEFIKVVTALGRMAENYDFNDTDAEDISAEISKLNEEVLSYYELVQSSSLPVQTLTPGLKGLQTPSGGRASEMAVSNAKYRVAVAQENLKFAMESADKTREQMIEINKEYIEALTKMQRLKVDEIRYDEAIKLLQEGLVLLTKLKEHWAKLVMFFQQISNIIETVMAVNLKDFVALADKTSTKLVTLEFPVTLDLIYDSVMKASQASYLVHNMADLYTQVSTKYIMDNVIQLNRLIAFDAAKEGITIEAKRDELLKQCTEDSEKIIQLVMDEKAKLIQDMQGRVLQISNEYQPIFEEAENMNNAQMDESDNEIYYIE